MRIRFFGLSLDLLLSFHQLKSRTLSSTYSLVPVCTPFKKKGGSIRPIAVGNTFRRLFLKLSLHSVMNSLREDLLPCQLGVGVRMGCESAVHATRSFINHSVDPKVLLKLDVSNALYSIDRKRFIGEIATRYPSLYFLVNEAYSNSSTLYEIKMR